MWFSSKRPERPERRPSHGTVVAYLALLVAVLGIPVAAVAAGALVHTRDIANRAVTTPKLARHAVGPFRIMNGAVINRTIRNHAVGRVKLRTGAVNGRTIENGAITGAKVAANTLTGHNINVATLHVTRVVHHFTGGQMTAPDQHPGVAYPLTGGSFTQPAHTWDMYAGRWQVHFPADCTGYRAVVVDFFDNGKHLVSLGTVDFGNGQAATLEDANSVSSDLFPTAAVQRHITADVRGWCENAPTVSPRVDSLRINVIRFQ